MLDDDGIAAKRKMRPVLLARADGYDETRIIAQNGGDLRGIELLYAQRSGLWKGGGKGHRVRW